MQVSFLKFLPVTINVGIFAFLWLWIGLKYELVLWVTFIGWSMWYVMGPSLAVRRRRAAKNFVGAVGGVLYAIIFILLIPKLYPYFGGYTIPALGFLAGMTIVLLELTNWFEVATSYFFTFAGYFGFAFACAAFGGLGDYAGIFQGVYGPAGGYIRDVIYFIAMIAIGFGIGFVTDTMRFWILYAEGLKDESQQKTIFDKE